MRHRAREAAARAVRVVRIVPAVPAVRAVRAASGVPGIRVVRVVRIVPAALAFVVGAAVVGCGAAAGGTPAATTRPAATAGATAPVDGPAVPDAACLAAEKAEQTLQSRQGQDRGNESALDQDYTNFASALSAAAQVEKHPAAARAMTALANDYTALVESQSGAAQLPSLSQIQRDGAAFDRACSP